MPANLTLSLGTLCGFLLVLARVTGAMTFVPMPGFNAAPGPVRIVFSLGFTLALFSRWPVLDTVALTFGKLAVWAVAEAVTGIAIGLTVAIVLETFTMAAQVLGLQAGYAYAQTVDPNTQADSGILLVLAQLMGGLLFFACGLDREVLRLFAQSLEKVPAGAYVFGLASADAMIRLASGIFSVGVRLALPVVALLVMVDVALALLGRLNSQLQLLSVAFPIKMLIALVVLSWIAVLFPRILMEFSGQAWQTAHRILGI
jgi:flagellar biosynthetic protein FliR